MTWPLELSLFVCIFLGASRIGALRVSSIKTLTCPARYTEPKEKRNSRRMNLKLYILLVSINALLVEMGKKSFLSFSRAGLNFGREATCDIALTPPLIFNGLSGVRSRGSAAAQYVSWHLGFIH
jgi:hypothetical protein